MKPNISIITSRTAIIIVIVALSGCPDMFGSPESDDGGNRAPVADAGPDQEIELGAMVILDGGGSSDANGDALTYEWAFTVVPDTSTLESEDITDWDTASATFAPDMAGTYTVRLTVSDGDRSDSDLVSVTVLGSDSGGDDEEAVLHDGFGVTGVVVSGNDDWDAAVQDAFGPDYRVADWGDLVAYHDAGGDLLALYDGLGLTDYRAGAFVTSAGDKTYSSTRYYFAERHEHNRPGSFLVHGHIDNYLVSLGSWSSSKRVLSVRDGDTQDPDDDPDPTDEEDEVEGGDDPEEIEDPTYTVTYEAGDADDGTVPTDDTEYGTDGTVTIADNSGGLTRTGFVFGGWNTAEDGSGNEYNAGDSFTIDSDTILYARWENTPPSVSIDTPSEGEQVSKNDIVTFAATISDTEESNSSLELVWRVDGGGNTGTSNPISMNAISDIGLGEHTITLSVTDSGGLTTEESVTIEVLENVESGITIEF
jgi:uncharacterized repeat protein (TIGR02543 family)